MEFAELATAFAVDVDRSKKIPKFAASCPVAGCKGDLIVKDFGDALALICSVGCSRESIESAIKQRFETPSVPAQQSREAGEENPHHSPASPPAKAPRATSRPVSTVRSTPVDNDDLLRRLPPQNIGAEMACLAAAFVDRETIPKLRAILKPEDFYRETHRRIFDVMLSLYTDGISIDALTVSEKLRSRGILDEIGGMDYLKEIAEAHISTLHLKDHAEIIRAMSVKREVAVMATELASMAYNGVSADALVGEMQRRASSLDRIKSNAVQDIFAANIQPLTGKDILRRARENPVNRTVTDGFLLRKQVSMWAGKVEAGKTSLLRELSMCILRGDSFLGRSCVQGRVTYLMLDADGEDLTRDEFLKMGWDPETEDGLEFIFDPIFAQKPKALDQFHAYLLERKPSLVVIDPLGRFIKAEDFNAYGMTYVMAVISEMAKATDCHFAVPQHIPRGRHDEADTATAAYGSIAIGGSVNARFVCTRKPGDVYTLKTSRGKGSGFVPLEEEIVLKRDPDTGRITTEGAYSWKDQARALKEQVFKVVDRSDEPMTASAIAKEVGAFRSAAGSAANMLYSDGRIGREGSGKKNSKYTYTKLVQSSLPNGNNPEN